ncbi:MAG: hypothetical protein FWD59_05550 [Micrococcales bacterium]|nr:hypothetical protein [Micrococcales bacterium]
MPRRRRRRPLTQPPKVSARRRIGRVAVVVVAVICVVIGGFLAIETTLEYRPRDSERLTVERAEAGSEIRQLAPGDALTLLTFNVGYAGLGKDQDFYAHGGKMVNPPGEAVEANLAGILATLTDHPADAVLLQEVDTRSRRSGGVDQSARVREVAPAMASVFATNLRSFFAPFPVPPIGRLGSGLQTLSVFKPSQATRVALPGRFGWPARLFHHKRCLVVERTPVGVGRELVLINLQLDPTSDDGARMVQLGELKEVAAKEYSAGNYVIIGGDFGEDFPGVSAVQDWVPGTWEVGKVPTGWTMATGQGPTARLTDKPWDGSNEVSSPDGFIASPNVTLTDVRVVDLGFEHSHHNPVMASATLMP